MKMTAIIEKSNDGWFVGQLEEFPEVLSQGRTVPELKDNLLDALHLLIEANRQNTMSENADREIFRELLEVG